MLARVASIDPVINAFLTVTGDEAIRQARHAEAEISDGAYRGVRWRSGRDAALAEFVLDHALPYWRAVADAPDVASALAMLRRHRVLTALREGDAGVSSQHALVLVNHGKATGAQILALAQRVQAGVANRFGVALEPEPTIL